MTKDEILFTCKECDKSFPKLSFTTFYDISFNVCTAEKIFRFSRTVTVCNECWNIIAPEKYRRLKNEY